MPIAAVLVKADRILDRSEVQKFLEQRQKLNYGNGPPDVQIRQSDGSVLLKSGPPGLVRDDADAKDLMVLLSSALPGVKWTTERWTNDDGDRIVWYENRGQVFGMTEDDYQRTYRHILKVVANRMMINQLLSERELQQAIETKDAMAYQLAEHYRNAYKAWWSVSKAIAECRDDTKLGSLRMELMGKIKERDNYRRSIESYLAAKYLPVAQ